jgi:hypothetical protein
MPEIGPSRPCIGQFGRGLDGRIQPGSRRVEKVFQGCAVREFGRAALGGTDIVKAGKAGFQDMHGAFGTSGGGRVPMP